MAVEKSNNTPETSADCMVVVVGNGSLQVYSGRGEGEIAMPVDLSWQCEPADALTRLEDVVYEKPELFDDVPMALLLRPTVTTVVPSELLSGNQEESVAAILDRYDLSDAKDCFAEPIGDADGNMLLYTMPAGMRGFLERCFPTERICHELLPFLKCFMPIAAAEKGDRMWADVHGSYVDVAAFRDGRLLIANRWHWRGEKDIVYYLVYLWRTLGLDGDSGHLCVSGPSELRNRITSEMRHYINYVTMPELPREVKTQVSAGVPVSVVEVVGEMRKKQQKR